MLQILGIAACIAIFAFLVTFAAALTWTAICMIAGGGIACVAAYFFFEGKLEKERRQHRLQQEWERETEYQRREEERESEYRRMLVLLHAAQKANVTLPTLEIPKQKVQRLGKR